MRRGGGGGEKGRPISFAVVTRSKECRVTIMPGLFGYRGARIDRVSEMPDYTRRSWFPGLAYR